MSGGPDVYTRAKTPPLRRSRANRPASRLLRRTLLGDDLSTAWSHPDATAETRKAILRAVLEEIVVTLADGCVDLLLHWRGGDHTRLSVPRNRTGQHRWAASAEVVDLVRGLARQLPDGAIAATLNRLGKKTGRGNSWTEARVRTGQLWPWSSS